MNRNLLIVLGVVGVSLCGSSLSPGRAQGIACVASTNVAPAKHWAGEDIEQYVKDTVIDVLGVDAEEVTPEARVVEDLGADDLDRVELIMAVEDEFEITISDTDATKLLRVKDLIDYFEKMAKPKPAKW